MRPSGLRFFGQVSSSCCLLAPAIPLSIVPRALGCRPRHGPAIPGVLPNSPPVLVAVCVCGKCAGGIWFLSGRETAAFAPVHLPPLQVGEWVMHTPLPARLLGPKKKIKKKKKKCLHRRCHHTPHEPIPAHKTPAQLRHCTASSPGALCPPLKKRVFIG